MHERGEPDRVAPRVLVLRPGAIGDTLLAYPALLALRARYPQARLHLIGNPVAAALLAAQRTDAGPAPVDPDPSHIATGPTRVDAGRTRVDAGRTRVDADWAPFYHARALVDDVTAFDAAPVTGLFLASGPSEAARSAFAPVGAAIAWCADPDGVLAANLRRLGADPAVIAPSRPGPNAGVHVADYLLASLAPLGIDADDRGSADAPGIPALVVAPEWSAWTDVELGRLGLADRTIVLIHPGSGSASKNWPAERFAAVLGRLPDVLGAQGIVLVGPAEEGIIDRMRASTSSAISVLSDLPLTTLAGLIRRARAYLGNDSGLTHLAGLLGVPTLALFGPTDPAQWAPRGPAVRILRRQPIASLAVADVLAELVRLVR